MSKPVLAVDVDDVLAPFGPSYLEYFNKQHGTNHKMEDFPHYYFVGDLNGVDNRDAAEPYITEYVQWAAANNTPLDATAVEGLRKLEEHYDIYVITSRHPDVYEVTKDWLQTQVPNVFKDVHFIRARAEKTSKPQICEEIGAKFLIEDHPEHLADCAKYGVRGLLYGDYAWNRDVELPENVERVRTWNDVLEVLL